MFVIQREYIADYLKRAPSTVQTESLFRSEENHLAGETLTPLERRSCIINKQIGDQKRLHRRYIPLMKPKHIPNKYVEQPIKTVKFQLHKSEEYVYIRATASTMEIAGCRTSRCHTVGSTCAHSLPPVYTRVASALLHRRLKICKGI